MNNCRVLPWRPWRMTMSVSLTSLVTIRQKLHRLQSTLVPLFTQLPAHHVAPGLASVPFQVASRSRERVYIHARAAGALGHHMDGMEPSHEFRGGCGGTLFST